MSNQEKDKMMTRIGAAILALCTTIVLKAYSESNNYSGNQIESQTTISAELLEPIEATNEVVTTEEVINVSKENAELKNNEQVELVDKEKLKLDVKFIQQELHIPDKYMEIPEVLDLIMHIVNENKNYMLGFKASDLEEKLAKLSSNKVRYSVDGNFSYNENFDQLIIFKNIDGQKHQIKVDFYNQNSPYYITDRVVFDKNGNPINNVIITSTGLEFNRFNEDYIGYTTSDLYIEFDYVIGNTHYKLTMNDYEIDILNSQKLDEANIKSEYKIKTTEDYKTRITKSFNEKNQVELKNIIEELIKNNSLSSCELSEIVTNDKGNLNYVMLSLDKNELDASLCETVRIHYDTHESSETYINYLDPYEFEYTITDEEEQELSKHILNGDCNGAVNYAKVLDKKYKK